MGTRHKKIILETLIKLINSDSNNNSGKFYISGMRIYVALINQSKHGIHRDYHLPDYSSKNRWNHELQCHV